MFNKNIDLLGKWFLPEFPDEKRHGQFTSIGNNSILRISGTLRNIESLKKLNDGGSFGVGKYRNRDYRVIIGNPNNSNQVVTLFDCFINGGGMNALLGFPGEESHSLIKPYKYLIGDLGFNSADEVKFDKLKFKFVLFNQFTQITNFSNNIHFVEKDGKTFFDKSIIECNLNYSAKIFNAEPYIVKLEFNYRDIPTHLLNDPLFNGSFMKEECWLTFEKKDGEKINYSEVHKLQYLVRNFLCLALRKNTYSVETIGQINGKDLKPPRKVEIFFDNSEYKEISKVELNGSLFNLSDIEESFGDVLSKWLANYEKYKTVYDNFFGFKYKPDSWVEYKFLSLITSIEAFYNASELGVDIPSNNLKEIVDSAKEKVRNLSVNSKMKKYILKHVEKYGQKNINLPSILAELKSSFDGILDDYIVDTEIELIVKIRNDLAHGNIFDSADFDIKLYHGHDLLFKLERIVECLLLRIAGLTNQEIDKIIHRVY